MTKRSELSHFWIWDFDIHLTFGFWHLALIHTYFAKRHFFDPIIASFQYSFDLLLQHSISSLLRSLDVESEVDNVSILDQVILSFQANKAFLLCFLE